MLQSAKRTLTQLPYFGLTEYQKENQILFEHTFGLRFVSPGLIQLNASAQKLQRSLEEHQVVKVINLNLLDLELYDFAKKLFFSRLNMIN